jgi:hypothetical protein
VHAAWSVRGFFCDSVRATHLTCHLGPVGGGRPEYSSGYGRFRSVRKCDFGWDCARGIFPSERGLPWTPSMRCSRRYLNVSHGGQDGWHKVTAYTSSVRITTANSYEQRANNEHEHDGEQRTNNARITTANSPVWLMGSAPKRKERKKRRKGKGEKFKIPVRWEWGAHGNSLRSYGGTKSQR